MDFFDTLNRGKCNAALHITEYNIIERFTLSNRSTCVQMKNVVINIVVTIIMLCVLIYVYRIAREYIKFIVVPYTNCKTLCLVKKIVY